MTRDDAFQPYTDQALDTLDFDQNELRWVMTCRDGRVRKSQYRHDLIHEMKRTKLTESAKKRW